MQLNIAATDLISRQTDTSIGDQADSVRHIEVVAENFGVCRDPSTINAGQDLFGKITPHAKSVLKRGFFNAEFKCSERHNLAHNH